MSEITITAAIKSIISNLSVNNVHDYQRWTKDQNKFHDLFRDNNKIYGWEITVNEINFERIDVAGLKWAAHYDYEIVGYLGVNDLNATEKTMRSAAYLVLSELVKGSADTFNRILPTQAKPLQDPKISLDYRMFGNVLCNRARITFTITELNCFENITEYSDMYFIGISYNWPEYDDREYDSRHTPRPGEDAYDIDPATDEVDDLIILEE